MGCFEPRKLPRQTLMFNEAAEEAQEAEESYLVVISVKSTAVQINLIVRFRVTRSCLRYASVEILSERMVRKAAIRGTEAFRTSHEVPLV